MSNASDSEPAAVTAPADGNPRGKKQPHRQPRRSSRSGLLAALLVCLIAAPLRAGDEEDYIIPEGTTAPAVRAQAIHEVPFERLPRHVIGPAQQVVRGASLYRRLPKTTVNADPDLFLFLARYPEVIVGTWQLMGITQMTARRTGPTQLTAHDGSGTQAKLELVYGDAHTNVYFGEGTYDGPLLMRKVQGQCLVVLHSEYRTDSEGRPLTSAWLDIFLKIDHLAASVVARTVSPLVGSTADRNFVETMRFVENLHQTTVRNGEGVEGMARRLRSVRPEVRDRFSELAGMIHAREGYALVNQTPVPPAGSVAAQLGDTSSPGRAVQRARLPSSSGGTSAHPGPARPRDRP